MSYKLNKPYKTKERIDFIVLHNHNNGRRIEETSTAIYALEANEIMQNGVPVIDDNYENKQLKLKTEQQIQELNKELNDLDIKRIRAICEPEIKNKETGETWLDYYNSEIQSLRNQIQDLTERINGNDITI